MSDEKPQPKYRKDYSPPGMLVDHVDLRLDIQSEYTDVTAQLQLKHNEAAAADNAGTLRLNGRNMQLLSLMLDDQPLSGDAYVADATGLTLQGLPPTCTLTINNRIEPHRNTALEGFYKSGNMLCTQCEAEGFSRITYFPDRPDVLARFRTTLIADKTTYPLLLSNGDIMEQGNVGINRHFVVWDDPHPKPCYLFAAVAGDLGCLEGTHTTGSGREVAIRFYTERGNEALCQHGIDSLKKAMAWDENTYGLEYDLDTYMVVAVGSFNMGAMENKGLNIFNTACVLASPETATDSDFATVRSVIGHEYFHNYTGNRVTLRDWFQLSLKESLTVFREQQFAAAYDSPALQRIQQVRLLRSLQFTEDAGPTAHPVRPESYIEMNNFYTMTIYEKGAEIIRMLHTLLGHAAFTSAVRYYLHKHDGQAATIEDFLAALEQDSGMDLHQFRLWYSQAGTPHLHAAGEYDQKNQSYQLTLRQQTPPTPGQPGKQPLHIPVAVALATDAQGISHEQLLELREWEQQWTFDDVAEKPVVSLLRNFSAPVQLECADDAHSLAQLVKLETDAFARWEALQRLYLDILVAEVAGRDFEPTQNVLLDTLAGLFANPPDDDTLFAEFLTLPDETFVAEQFETIAVTKIVAAHSRLRQDLVSCFRNDFLALLESNQSSAAYVFNGNEAGRRRLFAVALHYLACTPDGAIRQRCLQHFEAADNMTDTMAVLGALRDCDCDEREQAFKAFEKRWVDVPLVLDKWFALQASSRIPGALERLRALLDHPRFSLSNPNRIRAVLRSFTRSNLPAFHSEDGSGYRLLADQVIVLDKLNPQMAARIVAALCRWQRYASPHGGLMRAELERIQSQPQLSGGVYELVSKSLAATQ